MAVEAGTRELKLARKYKSQSRKKCWFALCCVLLLLLGGGAAAFLLLYNDGEYWHDIERKLNL